ncbi:MAG: oligoendopeptidase, partial [Actinomycetota bacterium]|nr:oligoendopeptidase [Actinomycetota bacterium]
MTTDQLEAGDVVWDLSDLLAGRSPDPETAFGELLDEADRLTDALATQRGQVSGFDAGVLVEFMQRQADLADLLGRAGSWASLEFAADMSDPAKGARMQRYQERATAMSTKLIWFDLEWAAL